MAAQQQSRVAEFRAETLPSSRLGTPTPRGQAMESSAVLRPASAADRAAMQAMLADHLREIRAFGPVEEPYPYFDVYWAEATRWPYLIEVAGEPIGFVMVNRWSLSGRGTDHAIGEFYIRPERRRLGHGAQAAQQVFLAHPGQWELWIFAAN